MLPSLSRRARGPGRGGAPANAGRRSRLRRCSSTLWPPRSPKRFRGENLRPASRAPMHFVGLPSHLGVAALARVLAYTLREGDYLLQDQQRFAADDGTTGAAPRQMASVGIQLADFAHRADDGMRRGDPPR